MDGIFARLFEVVDLGSEVGQVVAKPLDTLEGLFLLLGDELLARKLVVLVDGLGEGGEGCRDVADLGWGQGDGLGCGVGELLKIFADGLALAQGRVVLDVLQLTVSSAGAKQVLRVPTNHTVSVCARRLVWASFCKNRRRIKD